MTSVAVISSAVESVERINRLNNDVNTPKEETDEILRSLKQVKGLLVSAHDPLTEAAGLEFVRLEKQVVGLSYEIVDAIEMKSYEKIGKLQKELTGLQDSLRIRSGFTPIYAGFAPRAALAVSVSPSLSPVQENNPEAKDKLGQEELMENLRTELLNVESSSVVYLVGESGMGKTTLARKLFHDQRIQSHFKTFAWVSVTQNFQIKDVLRRLLHQLDPRLDISKMNEIHPLISDIITRLKGKPYLLVLEDIQSMDDWESIRLALPTAQSSKVIITSSNKDLISIAIENNDPRFHHISGLNEAEIITLLKDEAAFRSDDVGKAICKISGGSPLLAIILGKSLRSSKENDEQLVHELQSNIPNINTARAPRVLEASYRRLDSELKPRLLYLGQFPAGEDVDIDKLYLLLEAENLIKEEDNISPQSLSEYLKELEGLKLVQVQEDHILPKRGLYKSCKLHDQVWEFCKSKASEEEFFQILDLGSPTPNEVGSETRRLAVHLRAQSKKSATARSIKPAALKKLLTLIINDTFEKKSDWPSELNDLKDSSCLKILSFAGVDFGARGKLPKGLDKLVRLKYLSFRGCRLEVLPTSLSSLTKLETLDLLVQDDCNMRIPNKIFAKMKRMVHLYFPGKYESDDKGKTKNKLKLQDMENLEILVNFDTGVCEAGDLNQFKKLKILSTISKGNVDAALLKFLTQGWGKELEYSSVGITSFDCYKRISLPGLQTLLGCKSVHSVRIEGHIGKLPEEGGGSGMSCDETIGEIVLDGSQLKEDPTIYLYKFKNLRSLVLSNNAFLGSLITISATNPFPNLRSLRLHNLKFLKKVTVQSKAMPELSALQIHGCVSLEDLSIPKDLDDRLKNAQERNGGDTYSVMPWPSNFKIVPV